MRTYEEHVAELDRRCAVGEPVVMVVPLGKGGWGGPPAGTNVVHLKHRWGSGAGAEFSLKELPWIVPASWFDLDTDPAHVGCAYCEAGEPFEHQPEIRHEETPDA